MSKGSANQVVALNHRILGQEEIGHPRQVKNLVVVVEMLKVSN